MIFFVIFSWKKEKRLNLWKLYLQQEPFRILREQYPERLKKLIVINGDMIVDGLSLSDADKERLTSKVSVIFNMAANVRFDLPLKVAVKTNTMGTINIVALAKQVNARYKFMYMCHKHCKSMFTVLISRVRSIWRHNVKIIFQSWQLFVRMESVNSVPIKRLSIESFDRWPFLSMYLYLQSS